MPKLRNTTIRYKDNASGLVVTLYNTDIVEIQSNLILLNTGGFTTNTTKRRMNQISEEFNLGFKVFCKDFTWYVRYKEEIIQFESNEKAIISMYM